MKRWIKAATSTEPKYVVHYGAPFSIQKKEFSNKSEMLQFIRSHVFTDPRYTYVEEVKPMSVQINFVNERDANDTKLRKRLFERGIATYSDWAADQKPAEEVESSTKFPGSGKDREDSMRNQWYIPEYYPDIDEDRIADFHRIDWKDIVAEDSEEFLKDEVTFPDLSAIKSIRYFEGPEQDWADEFNYEGGYVVDYNDGSKRYFVWTHGGGPLWRVRF